MIFNSYSRFLKGIQYFLKGVLRIRWCELKDLINFHGIITQTVFHHGSVYESAQIAESIVCPFMKKLPHTNFICTKYQPFWCSDIQIRHTNWNINDDTFFPRHCDNEIVLHWNNGYDYTKMELFLEK